MKVMSVTIRPARYRISISNGLSLFAPAGIDRCPTRDVTVFAWMHLAGLQQRSINASRRA